jgi:hypothetical protein
MQAGVDEHRRTSTSIIDMTLMCQYNTGKKLPRSQSTDNILGDLYFDQLRDEENPFDFDNEDRLFEIE